MIYYIIDGNNLIGKSKTLANLQKKDKKGVREKLVILLERYFQGRKAGISLHFDGFQGEPINTSILKIYYSRGRTADELIKNQIGKSTSPRNTILVSSDHNLMEYAKVCSCKVISSEKFWQSISSTKVEDEEKRRMDELNNPDEFKKLFGTK